MSTLHKVKAYFGMAPMEDYDDEYYEDDDRASSRGYSRRSREDRFDDDGYVDRAGRGYEGPDYDEPPAGYRSGYRDEDRFESRLRGPRDFDRPTPRFSALRGSTRCAVAEAFADGAGLAVVLRTQRGDLRQRAARVEQLGHPARIHRECAAGRTAQCAEPGCRPVEVP